MTTPKRTFIVEVDATNPGEFFACCGLLELAHRLWPGAEARFGNGRFWLSPLKPSASGLEDMLGTLIAADVYTLPYPDPKIAPVLVASPISIRLDWWLRNDGKANLFKTWAANATARQMFVKWRDPLKKCMEESGCSAEHLFHLTARVQNSYGFDTQQAWNALAVGFSLNEHARYRKLPTRPAVELLGAIGLQRFFPLMNASKQTVCYAAWSVPLSPPVARLAAIGLSPAAISSKMRTRFVYRGSFKGLDTATIIEGGQEDERRTANV